MGRILFESEVLFLVVQVMKNKVVFLGKKNVHNSVLPLAQKCKE